MDSDASENYEDLYEESDISKHDKLLEKVLSLNKTQNLKKPTRTEPSLQISEFNLVKSITGNKGTIEINELTKPLKDKKSRIRISEHVKKSQKIARTLPKPLEKPQANRIRRSVAYEKTRLELDRWEATVTSNRVSTNLSFPLNNDLKMDKKDAENAVGMWRVKSKLAEELDKIEPVKVEEYHIGLEQQEKFPLTMKEMLRRRKETAKLRAYQGYKEAKARRQNKIKSKKYHRIQKRQQIKKKLKEFEQLQKTNPEAALRKLEEIEKTRAQERFSLRHKSTGKWAKNQQIRAKYDKESRQNLAQQLIVSRELTQKLKVNDNSSDEEENEVVEKIPSIIDENNPWVNGIKPNKDVTDFIGNYRKYWMEQNMNKTKEIENNIEIPSKPKIDKIEERINKIETTEVPKKKRKENVEDANIQSTSDWNVSRIDDGTPMELIFDKLENKLQKQMLRNVKQLKRKIHPTQKLKENNKPKKTKIDLALPLQKKIPQIDDELIQNRNQEPEPTNPSESLKHLQNILANETNKTDSNIDPNKYLNVKTTTLTTAIPDILTMEDNEDEQRAVISEAFEDDDILDEFNKDKKDEIDRNKPKNINLALPGWGSWGGTKIKINRHKRRRFTIKPPKKIPRRDDNKGFLILNENAQSKVKEHMVSEVPFPFKTVKDFEASMRAPIGNTFVPETAFKKLIKPAVTTKMGTIIEPMSKDILINKKD